MLRSIVNLPVKGGSGERHSLWDWGKGGLFLGFRCFFHRCGRASAISKSRTMSERKAREVFMDVNRPVVYFNACSKSEVENPVNCVPPHALDGQHQASDHCKIRPAKPFTSWPSKYTKPN